MQCFQQAREPQVCHSSATDFLHDVGRSFCSTLFPLLLLQATAPLHPQGTALIAPSQCSWDRSKKELVGVLSSFLKPCEDWLYKVDTSWMDGGILEALHPVPSSSWLREQPLLCVRGALLHFCLAGKDTPLPRGMGAQGNTSLGACCGRPFAKEKSHLQVRCAVSSNLHFLQPGLHAWGTWLHGPFPPLILLSSSRTCSHARDLLPHSLPLLLCGLSGGAACLRRWFQVLEHLNGWGLPEGLVSPHSDGTLCTFSWKVVTAFLTFQHGAHGNSNAKCCCRVQSVGALQFRNLWLSIATCRHWNISLHTRGVKLLLLEAPRKRLLARPLCGPFPHCPSPSHTGCGSCQHSRF